MQGNGERRELPRGPEVEESVFIGGEEGLEVRGRGYSRVGGHCEMMGVEQESVKVRVEVGRVQPYGLGHGTVARGVAALATTAPRFGHRHGLTDTPRSSSAPMLVGYEQICRLCLARKFSRRGFVHEEDELLIGCLSLFRGDNFAQ